MNPAAWVERHARRRPDDPTLADGDRVHASWREFAARTAGAATSLRGHFGLSPGDRVAIVMRNRPARREVGRGGRGLRGGRRPRRPAVGQRSRPDLPGPHRTVQATQGLPFVDALPTNNYGKVVKRELRDRLRAETADGGSL
jgi:acyl-CoA synthetase (AMP-forming)/AMP-acid ligase II